MIATIRSCDPDRALALLDLAEALAVDVREVAPPLIHRRLAYMSRPDLEGIAIALAAQIPRNPDAAALLAWTFPLGSQQTDPVLKGQAHSARAMGFLRSAEGLADQVRELDPRDVHRRLGRVKRQQLEGIVVVLAAMVPDPRATTVEERLAWVNEWGRWVVAS